MPFERGSDSADALAKTCEPGTPVFLLIDPLAGEPVRIECDATSSSADDLLRARAAAWARDVVPVKLHPNIDLAPRLHPYLIALEGPDDPWLAESLTIAESERLQSQAEGIAGEGKAAMRIGGWLHSSAPTETVAQTLSDVLRVRCEVAVKACYQRLVDRRAFIWAQCVAGSEAVSAALGSIQRWTTLDAMGCVMTLSSNRETSIPLRWSAMKWRVFMQGDLVHQTLARYLGELCRRGQTVHENEGELLKHAHAAIVRAGQMKIRFPHWFAADHDITAWAALHLLNGETSMALLLNRLAPQDAQSEERNTVHRIVSSLNDALNLAALKVTT